MRFTVLDGWRGIAALSVALFHLRAVGHFYDNPFLRHAFLFVDFFFVLSGFVLTHAYRQRLNNSSQLKYFALQRFGRIYPLHIAIVLLFVLVELARVCAQSRGDIFTMRRAFTADASPLAFLSNTFLAHGLGVHDHLTFNGPSWSISVEFWTYLVFALVCLGTGMRTKATAMTAALLACGGAWLSHCARRISSTQPTTLGCFVASMAFSSASSPTSSTRPYSRCESAPAWPRCAK
jgi:peptidoglycan/LPS O-acetylase OafA/YrhL